MYVVGCDVGGDITSWSRVTRERGVVAVDASGSLRTAVGVDGDGQLQVVDTDRGQALAHETTGFVDALGGSEPIMVGATPYGPEALIAAVLEAVLEVQSDGGPPDALAIVHDDDLDPFRSSLLTEAARLAGVATERVVLVPRATARAAGADHAGDDASGGALVALAGIPADGGGGSDGDGGGVALAAGAAGLAAGGAVGLGTQLGEGGVASAVGPAAGPAGTPLSAAGPSGVSTGPTGTPLGSGGPTGPTGTPLGSAGPTGTPLGSAGPTGSPLGTAGPTGTPLAGPAGARAPVPKTRPRWIPAAVVGGVVAVVAVVGVVVLAQGNDDPPEDGVAAATTVGAGVEPVTTGASVEPSGSTEPASPTTEAAAAEFDTSAFIGEWQQECEPFLAGDGASTGRYAFEPAGPNQLALTISGIDFPTVECAGEGETIITNTSTLTIVGETVVEGRDAYFGESDIGAFVIAVDGDTLYLGEGSSFDPAATATRR